MQGLLAKGKLPLRLFQIVAGKVQRAGGLAARGLGLGQGGGGKVAGGGGLGRIKAEEDLTRRDEGPVRETGRDFGDAGGDRGAEFEGADGAHLAIGGGFGDDAGGVDGHDIGRDHAFLGGAGHAAACHAFAQGASDQAYGHRQQRQRNRRKEQTAQGAPEEPHPIPFVHAAGSGTYLAPRRRNANDACVKPQAMSR